MAIIWRASGILRSLTQWLTQKPRNADSGGELRLGRAVERQIARELHYRFMRYARRVRNRAVDGGESMA
jgi:hypothetical protein